jgi:hypothetical protein
MTENHQGHEVTITTKQGVSLSKTQKTSLNYLIQEALEAGGWKLINPDGNAETWRRNGEQVSIGKKLLRGTEPPSVIYEVWDPESGFRKTDSIVINLLCTRLAKSGKMSEWLNTINQTEN